MGPGSPPGRDAGGPPADAPQSLEALRERVARYVAEHRLFDAGERVLVACSGGVDSLAALGLLAHPRFDLDLVVGHVDHGLRPESPDEGARVAQIAESLGLPALSETLSLGGGQGRVSEGHAREARLAALERLADDVGAARIVLAHTASDQLETMLMRLVRGAGLQGLAGIPPRRGRFVRPLLPLSRAETESAVRALGWRPCRDPANRDLAFFRNRVRHEVVPLLERENPEVHHQAFRTAEVLRAELASARAWQRSQWKPRLSRGVVGWQMDRSDWLQLDAACRADCVRALWRALRAQVSRSELTYAHVVQGAQVGLGASAPRRVELPAAVVLLATRSAVHFVRTPDLEDPGDVALLVPGPGVFRLDRLGWQVAAWRPEEGDSSQDGEGTGGALAGLAGRNEGRGATPLQAYRAWLLPGEDFADGAWPLRVRNPRPGERVGPDGGERRVVDWLARRGVPAFVRRRWPVVLWQERPVWLPGCWNDPERVRVDPCRAGEPEVARCAEPGATLRSVGSGPRSASGRPSGFLLCLDFVAVWPGRAP